MILSLLLYRSHRFWRLVYHPRAFFVCMSDSVLFLTWPFIYPLNGFFSCCNLNERCFQQSGKILNSFQHFCFFDDSLATLACCASLIFPYIVPQSSTRNKHQCLCQTDQRLSLGYSHWVSLAVIQKSAASSRRAPQCPNSQVVH